MTRIVTLSIASVMLASASAFAQTPAPARLQVTIDGHSLGAIGIARPKGQPLIAIAPIARALKWQLVPTSAGARINDGSGDRVLRVGSRYVREGGVDVDLFSEPLVERQGALMLARNDAATLFSLHIAASRGAGVAFTSDEGTQGPLTVTEIPRPIAHVKPTPRPPPQARGSTPLDSQAGAITLGFENDGTSRIFRAGIAARGALLRANVISTGPHPFNPPLGSVQYGPLDRNVTFGASTDPLAGVVFRNGLFNGVDVYGKRAERAWNIVAGKRVADGRSELGVMRGGPGGSDALVILARNGHYDETVLRHSSGSKTPWGTLIEEWDASERGLGGGFTAKTAGRTFLESTASFALAGLPLVDNDAPTSIALGRNFSPAFTGTAGFALARGVRLSPYLGASVHASRLSASISGTPRNITASLGYRAASGYAQIEATPGINGVIAGQAMLAMRSGEIDAEISRVIGSGDASIEYHSATPGINFVAGVGQITGHHAAPILGLNVPFTRSLAIESLLRPANTGRSALQVSLVAGIPHRKAHVLTYPVTLRVPHGGEREPLRLLVDGAFIDRFSGDQTVVRLEPGHHEVFVETGDRRLGSPATSIDVSAATQRDLPLWPQRAIRGRVRFAVPASEIPQDASLAGITLVVTPGDIAVETDADGNFVFARQPFDPAASIGVDADTLPRGFAAPATIEIGEGPIDVPLTPARKIERQKF